MTPGYNRASDYPSGAEAVVLGPSIVARRCRALAGALLALSVTGTAAAQTAVVLPYEPSLTADISNLLIENGLDDLQHPARLAVLDKSAFYTLLTNRSGLPSYNLGTATNIGPGGLGLLASFYGSGYQSAGSSIYYDNSSGQQDGDMSSLSWNQNRRLAFYAGYGLPVRPLHVGFGARVLLNRQKSSADEDLICGGDTYTANDNESNTTSSVLGTCEAHQDAYQFLASVNWLPPGKLSLLAEFSLLLDQRQEVLEVEQDSPEYTLSAQGTSSTDPFSVANSVWLGLDLRPRYQLDEALWLTGLFSVHTGFYDKSGWTLQTATWDGSTGLDVTFDTLYDTVPSALTALRASAFLAAQWNVSSAASLRLGLGVRHQQQHSALNLREFSTASIESSDDATYEVTYATTSDSAETLVLAPVSLQMKATEKLTLRLSSQYVLSAYREGSSVQQLSNKLDGEDVPYDNDYTATSYLNQGSYARFGAELLFQPSPRADLSLATSNAALDRQGMTFGGLNLYGSATVYW